MGGHLPSLPEKGEVPVVSHPADGPQGLGLNEIGVVLPEAVLEEGNEGRVARFPQETQGGAAHPGIVVQGGSPEVLRRVGAVPGGQGFQGGHANGPEGILHGEVGDGVRHRGIGSEVGQLPNGPLPSDDVVVPGLKEKLFRALLEGPLLQEPVPLVEADQEGPLGAPEDEGLPFLVEPDLLHPLPGGGDDADADGVR